MGEDINGLECGLVLGHGMISMLSDLIQTSSSRSKRSIRDLATARRMQDRIDERRDAGDLAVPKLAGSGKYILRETGDFQQHQGQQPLPWS